MHHEKEAWSKTQNVSYTYRTFIVEKECRTPKEWGNYATGCIALDGNCQSGHTDIEWIGHTVVLLCGAHLEQCPWDLFFSTMY